MTVLKLRVGMLTVGFCLWLQMTCSWGQTNPELTPPRGPLTNANQLLSLSVEGARQHLPVELTGTVTFYDPRGELYFIQDTTAGAYIYASNWTRSFKPGQRVTVRGVTGRGLASAIVLETETQVLGEEQPPPPRRVGWQDVLSGQLDAQWLEVDGVVRRARVGWIHLVLDLAQGNNRIEARLANYSTNDLTRLAGARVRIQGVAANQYDTRKKISGYCIFIPGPEWITVVRPPMVDPYGGTVMLSTNVLTYASPDGMDYPVKLTGVVTMQVPGQWLAVRDKAGAMRLLTTQTNLVTAGAQVEAAGYPARRAGGVVLEDVRFREVGRAAPPAAMKVRLGDSPPLELAGELVQLDAEHLQTVVSTGRRIMITKSGGQMVNVMLPTNAPALPDLDAGSQFRLTGVLQFDPTESGPPTVALWLRTAGDLLMIQTISPEANTQTVRNWLIVGLLLVAASVAIVLRESPVAAESGRVTRVRRRSLRDVLLLMLASAGIFGVATTVNFFEIVVGWARRHERWQMDEVLTLLIILTWVVGLFSWRRWRDIEREVAIRLQVEADLREGEKQLRSLLEDRQRIGRDLHDGIIQSIYAIGLALEESRRLVESDPQQARQRLAKGLADLNVVIRDVRNFISGLEPEALKGAEFRTALKSLVLTMNESGLAKFVLQVDPLAADTLNSQQTVHLLHIAQEAMSNSLRHGGAKLTTVTLQRHEDGVRFEVQDDGAGFDLKTARPEGRGLRNIQARAQQIGGRLEMQSQPGQGTRLTLDLPANRSPAGN